MKEKKTDQRVDAPKEEFSLIPHETLLALYRNLLQCRIKRAQGLRRSANAWPFDAAAVAVAAKALSHDTVIANARNPVMEILRPTSESGLRRVGPNGISGLKFSFQLQAAIGSSLMDKTKKTGRISVIFAGGDSREAWTDSLETARAHRLPIVFVWNSGDEKTDHGRSRRRRNANEFEPGTELAHITADGNDVVAMYRVAHEAVDRARRDRGPTLIECVSFQIAGRKHQNAIANMESYLRGKGLLRRGLKQQLIRDLAS
ncbi:MAG TPA: thiamine pyrophosphate-dependent enzyme [Terracidiphilus sp.]|jgi:pyruvate dehydrogenase E1 component alpha subunit